MDAGCLRGSEEITGPESSQRLRRHNGGQYLLACVKN